MARFGRHADIEERGRKFQEYTIFIFNARVTTLTLTNPMRARKQARQQHWNHDQIALRVPPALLHFPMMGCRGQEETNCGERARRETFNQFAEDHWVLYGFASKILRLCRNALHERTASLQ